jgi:hypothetical protein
MTAVARAAHRQHIKATVKFNKSKRALRGKGNFDTAAADASALFKRRMNLRAGRGIPQRPPKGTSAAAGKLGVCRKKWSKTASGIPRSGWCCAGDAGFKGKIVSIRARAHGKKMFKKNKLENHQAAPFVKGHKKVKGKKRSSGNKMPPPSPRKTRSSTPSRRITRSMRDN